MTNMVLFSAICCIKLLNSSIFFAITANVWRLAEVADFETV
jgi:hypothetical protein